MALSVTIGGTDRVGALERDTLEIEQDASSYAATCSFSLIDEDNTLPVAELDEVLIEDGDVLFHGEIAGVKREQIVINNKDAWRLKVSCVDDHAKLDRVTVEYAHWDDLVATDIEMIDDLFDAYYSSGIDYSTYVTGTPLDPAMVEQTFEGISMREAIGKIAELSGARFYVHYAGGTLYFHYFASESNTAAFHLTDDSPNYADSYPYNSIDEDRDASELVNAVYIVGADTAKWVEDATSIAAYGRREGAVTNADLLTEAAVDDYGATFIAEHKDPKVLYQIRTAHGAGLRAGMQIRVVCTPKSLDETLNINRLRISYVQDTPYWDLDLGDTMPDFVSSARSLSDQISETVVQVTEISQDVFDVEAPGAPSFGAGNLTTGVAIDADGHQIVWIRATWGSVADADLDHYEVQLADNVDFNWPMVGIIRAGETLEYQWNGLQGNISYYARVRAVDWTGNYSAWSPASPGYLTVTSSADASAPAQVTGAAAAGARTLIGITWTDNTEADLSHYEIQSSANGSTGWTTRDTPRRSMFIDYSFTEAQIQASTRRYYRIRAVDTSGNEGDWSSTVNATVSPIGSDTIAAGAIITDKLAANCVVAGKVAADAIDTDQLVAGAVTATKVSISTLSAITADMGTLTAGEIRIGSGTVGVNFTGFRVMSSYLAGYSGNTLQAGIRASDGKFIWAAGVGILDATGCKIVVSTTESADRSFRFENSGNTEIARIAAADAASSLSLSIYLYRQASHDSYMYLTADAPSNENCEISLRAFRDGAQVGGGGLKISRITDSGYSIDYVDCLATQTRIRYELHKYVGAGYTQGYIFVPLSSPLTSTSWDGDAYSTTAKTLIDLSAVFSAPAGIKAVLVSLVVRDSASSAADPRIILSPNNTAGSGPVFGCGGQTNDTWSRGMLIVPCDANGDIYYQIAATGSGTFDIYMSVWGYWI